MSRNTINSRVFGSNVSEKIRNTFDNLQKGSFKTDELASVDTQYKNYLGDRPTFARMWSPTLLQGSAIDENDRKIDVQEVLYRVVNDNRTESYTTNEFDSVGVVNELSENDSLKPTAGITDVNISTGGSLGAVKYTDISFVVFSRRDFEEIYLPFFMKPGSTVILDYGWSDLMIDLYDIENVVNSGDIYLEFLKMKLFGGPKVGPNGELVKMNSKGQFYYHPDNDKEKGTVLDTTKFKYDPGFVNKPNHQGKVDSVIGLVQDYSANWDGTKFNCKIKLVSQNYSILDKEVSDENDLKFLFKNRFEEILIKFITGQDGKEIKGQFARFNDRSAENKEDILEKFYKNQGLASAKTNRKGIITENSIKSGIFYESYTESGNSKNRAPYISYGLFEDLFLNAIVLENVSNKENYNIEFNSKDCLVRYESHLYDRQIALDRTNSVLPQFLYPCKESEFESKLVHSYNLRTFYGKYEKGKSEHENEIKKLKNGGDYDYSDLTVVYLRDLFINTKLIAKAFETKKTINDVLVHIIEELNKDSFNVFDLKMISVNEGDGVIGLVDANLTNVMQSDDDTLVFDVYSQNSIVSSMNYEFVMPKSGLASVLAIGESPVRDMKDSYNEDTARFIEQLNIQTNEDNKILQLNLPRQKEKPDTDDKTTTFNYTLESENVTKIKNNSIGLLGVGKNSFVNAINAVKEKNKNQSNSKTADAEDTSLSYVPENQGKILGADSDSDYYGKLARQDTLYAKGENKPAPILPIELSLTVYGNNFLNIGNYISLNYLPRYLRNKVLFIIMNVEHKIDTNWTTTYKCQMRLRPEVKGQSIGDRLPVTMSNRKIRNLLGKDDRNKPFLYAVWDGGNSVPISLDKDIENEQIKIYKFTAKSTENTKEYPSIDEKPAGKSGFWCFNQVKQDQVDDLPWLCAVQSTLIEFISTINDDSVLNTTYNYAHYEIGKYQSTLPLAEDNVGFLNHGYDNALIILNLIVDRITTDRKLFFFGGDGAGLDALFNLKEGYFQNTYSHYKQSHPEFKLSDGIFSKPEGLLYKSIHDSSDKDKFLDILENRDNYINLEPDLWAPVYPKSNNPEKMFLITDYAFRWAGNVGQESEVFGIFPNKSSHNPILIPKNYFDTASDKFNNVQKFVKILQDNYRTYLQLVNNMANQSVTGEDTRSETYMSAQQQNRPQD